MTDEEAYRICPENRLGMAGTTPITLKTLEDGTVEARMGFALFGATNMDEDQFRAAQYNPFHPDFHDNYGVGKGATDEGALADLRRSLDEINDGLWI